MVIMVRKDLVKMLEIIFIIVIIILFKLPEWKFDNYMPPNGYEIDHNEMAKDRIANNLTKDQVMSNTVNGKYNKRKN